MANHLYGAEWTPERVEECRRLWADGLSCSQVATDLGKGLTRSAIAGKIRRLGLQRRGATFTRDNKPKPKVTRKHCSRVVPSRMTDESRKKAPTFFPEIERPDVQPLHISLALLNNKTCRWPYGEGPFTFCGCETLDGPYCFAHTLQAIGKGTESERKAPKDLERMA